MEIREQLRSNSYLPHRTESRPCLKNQSPAQAAAGRAARPFGRALSSKVGADRPILLPSLQSWFGITAFKCSS